MRAKLAAFVLLASVVASAAPAGASADCIGIDNDLDRLACYDREHGRTSRIEPVATPADNWSVSEETSTLTDDRNVYVTVRSEDTYSCRWNRDNRATLMLRCLENTTSLIIRTGCHMTASRYSDYGDVTYRLDDDPAATVSMNNSTNNESLGLWRGGQPIPVIRSMFGKSQMIARLRPYGENPITVTFNISGVEEAISPLREACNW